MKKYCFIAGSPRSGTTYLNRLLCQHPAIAGGAETHLVIFFSRLLEAYDDQQSLGEAQIGLHHWIERKGYEQELRRFFQRATFERKDPGGEASVYLEKTPSNARCLPVIDSMFEDVLVLHVIRDPSEVVSSLIRASKGWGKSWAPNSVKKATRLWKKAVSSACRDGRAMGERYFEFTYDRLKAEPNVVLAEISERLGIDFDDALIRRCVEDAGDTSDLPEGFVSHPQEQASLGRLAQWYVRGKTKSVLESFGLRFGI